MILRWYHLSGGKKAMKLITRDTSYAIRALCSFARHQKKLISVKDLFRESRIPRPFLRKILQRLNKKGLLKSYKGKGGGFVLACALDKISLCDVIEIFQGPITLTEHTFKKQTCPNIKSCNLKKKIDKIETLVIDELNCITIASLLK